MQKSSLFYGILALFRIEVDDKSIIFDVRTQVVDCMAIGTKVIQTRLIPRSWNFAAITLFGLVFTADRSYVSDHVLRHELIHCQQQLEWLYLPFYLLYVGEWLWHLVRLRDRDKAYRAISFEREAYRHQYETAYLKHRRHYANYRRD